MYRSIDYERAGDRADAYLAVARALIPNALISDEGYRRILQTAAGLPSRLAHFYGLLEFPLDDAFPLADLSYAIHNDSGCYDLLRPEWSRRGMDEPVWQHAVALTSGICSATSGLVQVLRSSGIEFDCSKDPNMCPAIFMTPVHCGSGEKSRANEGRMVKTVANLLGEKAYPRPLLEKTLEIITSLPSGSRISQFGIMLSRDPVAVRLCCEGLDRMAADKLAGFLKQAGYGGVSDMAISYRDMLSAPRGTMDLAIDADPSPEARLGWEIGFKNHSPAAEPGWQTTLDNIAQTEGCSASKIEAFLDTRNYMRIADNPEAWPGDIRRYWKKHKRECCSYIVVNPNHIKLILGGGGMVKAKGYLRITHYWKDLL